MDGVDVRAVRLHGHARPDIVLERDLVDLVEPASGTGPPLR